MRKFRVALLGYYGFDNLGDELLLQACINIITRNGIEREKILVLSNNPEESSQNFHVNSINRWNYREVMRAFRETETLILGGGGLFQDVTSLKSCVWYWGIMRLAKLFGVKILAWGQSIGPLNSKLSRIFAGNALRLCGKIHVRDDNSLKLAGVLGCKNIMKGNDLVLTLKPDMSGRAEKLPRKYMLVNLRPHEKLEAFVKVLKPNIDNNNVVGAALSPEDEEPLRLLGLDRIIRVRNFQEAEALWSGACSAVGMRLHFGVLSRIFRTPLALMPYDVKVSEFAKSSNVPCIIDEWREPVMPCEIPEDVCGEILSL